MFISSGKKGALFFNILITLVVVTVACLVANLFTKSVTYNKTTGQPVGETYEKNVLRLKKAA